MRQAATLAALRRRFDPAGTRSAAAWLRHVYASVGPRRAIAAAAGVTVLAAGAFALARARHPSALSATVSRGTLLVRLTESGVVKPASSTTYRSPLGGREAEIVFLCPEGTLVGEGDLLVRLDTTDLDTERARAVREMRQAEVDLKLAEAEREEGLSGIDSLTQGQRSLEVDEARTQLALVERRAERLTKEYTSLESLRQRGFITQDELEEAGFALEQARGEREMARRKVAALEHARPKDQRRAELQLAQKSAQRENALARLKETRDQLRRIEEQIEGTSLHAAAPGLVVYEDFLGASDGRRKVRVGDRVTGSHGIVTIPDVTRMVVETSTPEFQIHRLREGQTVEVRLDAFPDRVLAGRVARIGTVARSAASAEEKRFDFVVQLDESPPDLRPEMTARVDVAVAEKANVLLVPVNAVFSRGGSPICHVLRLFGTGTRAVALGDSNELYAEVLSGLSAGDRVSLLDAGGEVAPPPAGVSIRDRFGTSPNAPGSVPLLSK